MSKCVLLFLQQCNLVIIVVYKDIIPRPAGFLGFITRVSTVEWYIAQKNNITQMWLDKWSFIEDYIELPLWQPFLFVASVYFSFM